MRTRPALSARLHRALAWIASIALSLWLLSGALHPLMSWLAPQPLQQAPPPMSMPASALGAGWNALRDAQQSASLIRLVPGPDGALWQLSDDATQARRYLRVDGSAFEGGEAAYARWLAQWYLGDAVPVVSLTLQTQFDEAYPWVNRLLPVWRVDIGGDDPRSAWLHTETGVLASLSDARRPRLLMMFRQLHTLAALDRIEPLRVALIALAMTSLLLLAGSGLRLFLRRGGAAGARRWHRRLGIAVALPMLLMAGSGLLHALVQAGPAPPRGLALPPALPALPHAAPTLPSARVLQFAALIAHDTRVLLAYRSDDTRALQLVALDGDTVPAPEALARAVATRHLGAVPHTLEPITHFSPDYDFRNRRLPAWLARADDGSYVAIDIATGQQLDRQNAWRRAEGWVFATLHKWQPLAHALGSAGARDALQLGWLPLLMPLAWLGWRLRRRSGRSLSSR